VSVIGFDRRDQIAVAAGITPRDGPADGMTMILISASAGVLARLVRSLGRRVFGDDPPQLSTADGPEAEEREQLIRRILSSIHNNSILLCGRPGGGKTSILLYLKGRLIADEDRAIDFYPVYIDLRGVPEHLLFATIADAVLGQLSFAPPSKVSRFASDYDHRDLARDLRGVIHALGKRGLRPARLVLLVDAIDQLNHYNPQTTQRVRSLFMASLAENLVMVASAVEIDKHWEQEGSPWYNFFEEIELSPARSEKERTG
jgi:hypothetical protein